MCRILAGNLVRPRDGANLILSAVHQTCCIYLGYGKEALNGAKDCFLMPSLVHIVTEQGVLLEFFLGLQESKKDEDGPVWGGFCEREGQRKRGMQGKE